MSVTEGAKYVAGRPPQHMGLLRNEVPGAIYHVLARGADRRRIFVDDEDYRAYVRLLATVVRRQGWKLLCYCLMPNHVHLLIQAPEANLGNGMQWLQSRYALEFNRRHHRSGHLYERRFLSPIVKSDEALVRLVGYIVVNPVAARLCARAIDWPWGSHAALNANRFAPEWLAHGHLVDLLEEMTGARCYSELVATAEREHYRHKRPDVL
jgi:putative transposase